MPKFQVSVPYQTEKVYMVTAENQSEAVEKASDRAERALPEGTHFIGSCHVEQLSAQKESD